MSALFSNNSESLSVYIPMDRRQALASTVPLPGHTRGAVLFADISGFTPLTEKLAQELGPQRGAEELTYQLNRVFSALIDQVHCYRGSIIGFNGDAITCWFEGDPGRQATACALAMQQTMTQFVAITTPAKTIISLSIKVVVMSGPARRFLVGHAHIQKIEVLAGGLLNRLAVAVQQLQPGEVIVDAETIAQFEGGVTVQEWRAGTNGEQFAIVTDLITPVTPAPWVELPEVRRDIARSWLLAPIYEQVQRGKGEFLAGLRPVVTFFLKFSHLDYDGDEQADVKLDSYIRWVQTVLARYEGYLMQLTIGDKGSYLHAVFGAPIAHEDDPARAVAAALDFLTPPPEFLFMGPVQIGISQGKMYTGVYGNNLRRTYDIMGTEVNVAARLMSQAKPGQILVTERIRKATAHAYEFQELEPVLLKGLAAPMPVLTISGKRQEQMGASLKGRLMVPMVGRVAERAILAKVLQALLDGRSSRVIIEGEAGIGKSRLVQDLRQHAQRLGIISLAGAGDAVEKSTPYHAWRLIFRQLLGLDTSLDEANNEVHQAGRTHVLAWLEKNTPDLLHLTPLLNAVLPLDFPESDFTAQMTGEVRASNTHELLVGLFKATVSKDPLLLILEDAHWLDSASWVLARLISQEIHPLLLVVATRPLPDPSPDEYTFLLQDPATHYQRLMALTSAEIETLICQRLGVTNLPEPVMDLISHKAEGHPFFSEELAYVLRDTGFIQIREGKCQIAPGVGDLRALDFPDTIQGVITSRFDHLSPPQQVALKVASIIGRSFAFRTLHDVHPVETDKPHLYECLETLERLDLTSLETPAPDLSYIFKHIITQEVVYSLMPFAQRWQLHRSVAEWYERSYDDLSPFYPLLAHHWGQAIEDQSEPGLGSKAIDYLEKAGEQALRNYANHEAIRFFSAALQLSNKVSYEHANIDQGTAGSALGHLLNQSLIRRGRWERQLAEAYLGLGQAAESQKHFRQAALLLNKPEPATRSQFIFGTIKQVLTQIIHRLWPAKFLGRSQETDEVSAEVVRLYDKLCISYYFTGGVVEPMYALFYGLNQAETAHSRLDLTEELARGYANVGIAFSAPLHLHAVGNLYLHLARETAEDGNHLPALAYVLLISGLVKVVTGVLDQATDQLTESLKLYERLGNQRQWEEGVNLLAILNYFQGKFTCSRELGVDQYDSARRRSDIQSQVTGLSNQVLALLALGQITQTRPLLEQAAGLLADKDYYVGELLVNGLAAQAYLYQGDHQGALQKIETAANLIEKAWLSNFALEGFSSVAAVSLALWEVGQQQVSPDSEKLAKIAAQAITALRTTAHQKSHIHQPRAELYQGWYDWLAGKPGQARKVWQKSLASAERFGLPYEQGRIHYEIGRHLLPTDPARSKHLTRAREFFGRLDAAYDLAQVQAALI